MYTVPLPASNKSTMHLLGTEKFIVFSVFWVTLDGEYMIAIIVSYINWVLIYSYIKHNNEDVITTRVLLFGLIDTIIRLINISDVSCSMHIMV